MRNSLRRRLLVVATTSIALLAPASPADAAIWSGACALDVTFTFQSPVRSGAIALSHPGYNLSASGQCAITLDIGNPLRTTAVIGSGTSDAWTCEAALGSGTWNQDFDPDPPDVLGSHRLDGVWDAWTLVVQDPGLTFLGVAELVVDPSQPDALVRCLTGGLTSLRTTGVMVFQDP
ncbi:MAG: hypothetical protein ACRDJP_05110 [Actinomycetota bacterium]